MVFFDKAALRKWRLMSGQLWPEGHYSPLPFNLGSELELQKTLGSDIGDMQGSLGLLEKINNKSRNKNKSRNRLAQLQRKIQKVSKWTRLSLCNSRLQWWIMKVVALHNVPLLYSAGALEISLDESDWAEFESCGSWRCEQCKLVHSGSGAPW